MTGDPKNGEKIFKARAAQCHTLSKSSRGVGPSLFGVFGRRSGSETGFNYSEAMSRHSHVWTEETLNAFLENPKKFMPGTKMSFAGLKKPEDRADLIAYLKSESETSGFKPF